MKRVFFSRIIVFAWTHLDFKFWALSLQEDLANYNSNICEPSLVEKFPIHFETLIFCSKFSVVPVKSRFFNLSGKWVLSLLSSIFFKLSYFKWKLRVFFSSRIMLFSWTHHDFKLWALSLLADLVRDDSNIWAKSR